MNEKIILIFVIVASAIIWFAAIMIFMLAESKANALRIIHDRCTKRTESAFVRMQRECDDATGTYIEYPIYSYEIDHVLYICGQYSPMNECKPQKTVTVFYNEEDPKDAYILDSECMLHTVILRITAISLFAFGFIPIICAICLKHIL